MTVKCSDPVTALSGVAAGGAREKQLHKLGIFTIYDLLTHYPRAYENRGDEKSLSDLPDGENHSYILTVVTSPVASYPRRGLSIVKFRASDGDKTAEITFFNQPYLKKSFSPGGKYRFYGKLTEERGSLRMTSPSFELYRDGGLESTVPIYPLTAGLTRNALSSLIKKALASALPSVSDYLPEKIRVKRGLSSLRYALSGVHFPDDKDMLERSVRRLIYDEFFLFSLRISKSRELRGEKKAPEIATISSGELDVFLSRLGYTLTGAQTRAIREIAADISKGTPMARIVVGDVGCGKTVVAAAAAYITAKSSYQTVLMAPTEILTRQHYEDLSALLSPLGMNVTLLTGSMKAAERRLALSECSGTGLVRADLIIGTHALIENSVQFDSLGLVITDEQHRFGALQRAALSEKSEDGVHTLVMSATPIPRTLSLVIYGDLDISVIDEMPKGRQRVDTFVVDESYRERLYAFIRKNVGQGGQVYIVCPAVGDEDDNVDGLNEADDMKSAVLYAKELSENVFPDLKVAFVHGKMKGADKDAAMKRFADGETDILVSTTVIEVGMNVPRATLMIVENAERFGLSQLHQLRGRVGRGSMKSYCILVSEYAKKEGTRAYERLSVMKNEYDGFKIAESDLAARGPGDFLPQNGTLRQSGGLGFKLARTDNEEGTALLKLASDDAKSLNADEADDVLNAASELCGERREYSGIIS